jgi:hypothetical protein
MNRIVSGTVKAAGSLAVVGGVLVASAMPAGAVTLPRSWGAQATGTTSLPQVALAWAGNTYQSALNVSAPPILSTGFILDRAGPNTAYSSVTSPAVSIASALALVSATKVASTCDTGTAQDSTVWGGTIRQYGQPTIKLPLKPAINTQIQIPGGVTITLNKRNVYVGIRQVTAMYVAWSGQNVSLGVSRCAS